MSFGDKDQQDSIDSQLSGIHAAGSAASLVEETNSAQSRIQGNPPHVPPVPAHQAIMAPQAHPVYANPNHYSQIPINHGRLYANQHGNMPYRDPQDPSAPPFNPSYIRAYHPPMAHHSSPPPHMSSPIVVNARPSTHSQIEIEIEKNRAVTAWDSDNDDPPPIPTLLKKPKEDSVGPTHQVKVSGTQKPVKKDTEKEKLADGADQKKKGRGGRSEGSRNFSEREMMKIVELVRLKKPIGADMWSVVEGLYNEWARKYTFLVRDSRSIKNKFDMIVKAAKVKPTGEATRPQLYEDALLAEEELINFSGTQSLDDDINPRPTNSRRGSSPVEVSDSDSIKSVKKETVATVKSYKTNNPLTAKPRNADNTTSQISGTIANMGAFFSSERVQQRDESRAFQSMGLIQLQSTQTELRELRNRYEQLQEKLHTKTRRADRLELRNETLRDQLEDAKRASRTRRRRGSFSDSLSPRPRHRGRMYSSPSPYRSRQRSSHSFSRHADQPVASGSNDVGGAKDDDDIYV